MYLVVTGNTYCHSLSLTSNHLDFPRFLALQVFETLDMVYFDITLCTTQFTLSSLQPLHKA